VSVHFYPEESEEHIADITLIYPFSNDQLENMRHTLDTVTSNEVNLITEDSDAKALIALFKSLSNKVERVSAEDATDIDNTAYGAYLNGKATDLGISLAFKLVCSKMGFECYVVDGRYKSVDHYWNIVKIDGNYYNCDPYRAGERSIAECIFRSDAEISREYWRDSEAYPECNGELNYFIVTGTAE